MKMLSSLECRRHATLIGKWHGKRAIVSRRIPIYTGTDTSVSGCPDAAVRSCLAISRASAGDASKICRDASSEEGAAAASEAAAWKRVLATAFVNQADPPIPINIAPPNGANSITTLLDSLPIGVWLSGP